MPYMTYEQAQAVHKTLSEDNQTIYVWMRRWAADSYCTSMREITGGTDFDCGSSDVSIELTERIRFFEAPLVPQLLLAYRAHGIDVPSGAPFVSAG